MEVEFLVENIGRFIPLITKILPSHAQIPVTSNVLLKTTKKDFFVYATDLEFGIRVRVPAKIIKEGEITVPGRQFIEIVNSIPQGKVGLLQDKDKVVINFLGNNVSFQTIPAGEFPALFEEKGEKISGFDKKEFGEIFSKQIFAASQDETRPALTGILLSQKKGFFDLVATDGYRMSLLRKKGKRLFEQEKNIILPTKLIDEAILLKEEGGEVIMYENARGNQVLLEVGGVILAGRQIAGEFPDYEKVVPLDHRTRIRLEREEFLQALKVALVFAREGANIVRLKTEDKTIKIFSRSEGIGEGEAMLDVEQEGDNNEIAFNIKFLLDFLRNIEGERIVFEMSGPLEPAVFRQEKDPDFLHVIMPVRVQE